MIAIRQLKNDLRQRFGRAWKKATIKEVAVAALVELARRHVATQENKHGGEGILFVQEVATLALADVVKGLADHPEPTPEQLAAIQADMEAMNRHLELALSQMPDFAFTAPEVDPEPPPPVRDTNAVASDFLRDLRDLQDNDDGDDDGEFELV